MLELFIILQIIKNNSPFSLGKSRITLVAGWSAQALVLTVTRPYTLALHIQPENLMINVYSLHTSPYSTLVV